MKEQQCPHTTSGLGTRYQPFSGAQLEDPYAFYAIARREEPIFFSDVLKMWIVTRYDDVRSVLKEPNLFSSKDSIQSIAPLCPEALAVLRTGVPPVPFIINSDRPEHSRWRRVINRAFSGARMQVLEPQIPHDHPVTPRCPGAPGARGGDLRAGVPAAAPGHRAPLRCG